MTNDNSDNKFNIINTITYISPIWECFAHYLDVGMWCALLELCHGVRNNLIYSGNSKYLWDCVDFEKIKHGMHKKMLKHALWINSIPMLGYLNKLVPNIFTDDVFIYECVKLKTIKYVVLDLGIISLNAPDYKLAEFVIQYEKEFLTVVDNIIKKYGKTTSKFHNIMMRCVGAIVYSGNIKLYRHFLELCDNQNSFENNWYHIMNFIKDSLRQKHFDMFVYWIDKSKNIISDDRINSFIFIHGDIEYVKYVYGLRYSDEQIAKDHLIEDIKEFVDKSLLGINTLLIQWMFDNGHLIIDEHLIIRLAIGRFNMDIHDKSYDALKYILENNLFDITTVSDTYLYNLLEKSSKCNCTYIIKYLIKNCDYFDINILERFREKFIGGNSDIIFLHNKDLMQITDDLFMKMIDTIDMSWVIVSYIHKFTDITLNHTHMKSLVSNNKLRIFKYFHKTVGLDITQNILETAVEKNALKIIKYAYYNGYIKFNNHCEPLLLLASRNDHKSILYFLKNTVCSKHPDVV